MSVSEAHRITIPTLVTLTPHPNRRLHRSACDQMTTPSPRIVLKLIPHTFGKYLWCVREMIHGFYHLTQTKSISIQPPFTLKHQIKPSARDADYFLNVLIYRCKKKNPFFCWHVRYVRENLVNNGITKSSEQTAERSGVSVRFSNKLWHTHTHTHTAHLIHLQKQKLKHKLDYKLKDQQGGR